MDTERVALALQRSEASVAQTRPPALASSLAGVLALQRSAGNAAIASLVRQRTPTAMLQPTFVKWTNAAGWQHVEATFPP